MRRFALPRGIGRVYSFHEALLGQWVARTCAFVAVCVEHVALDLRKVRVVDSRGLV